MGIPAKMWVYEMYFALCILMDRKIYVTRVITVELCTLVGGGVVLRVGVGRIGTAGFHNSLAVSTLSRVNLVPEPLEFAHIAFAIGAIISLLSRGRVGLLRSGHT